MMTQSLLLSCLLMGLGVAHHPASEGTQTQNVPSSTTASWAIDAAGSATSTQIQNVIITKVIDWRDRSSTAVSSATSDAGSATSTVPPRLQDDIECDVFEVFKIKDAAKTFCFCGLNFPDWLGPNLPAKCEAVPGVEDYADYLEEQCPDDPEIVPFICLEVQKEVPACAYCPQVQECQNLSQVLNRHDVPFWDDSAANNESCPFFSPDDQGKNLHFRRDATASVFRSILEDSLERPDADEPYHPILKAIYEDCDALEDPELHLDCVIKEIQRSLCEQEPWILACEDLESDGAGELPSKPVVSDDGPLSQLPVTAAPEPTETASLAD